MIIIQLLLLGAVCWVAWYIIKRKEKTIKNLRLDLKESTQTIDFIYRDLERANDLVEYYRNIIMSHEHRTYKSTDIKPKKTISKRRKSVR